MSDFRKVLVLAPHVDDEIFCAGAVRRLREEGASVLIVAGSACLESVPDGISASPAYEFAKSCELLGVESSLLDFPVRRFDEHRQEMLDMFCELNKDFAPDLVFCPSGTDGHQDHAVVHREARRAFRGVTTLGWESPNNQRVTHTDVFWAIDEADLGYKINIWRGYQSQHHRVYFNGDTIRSLATVRGHQCRSLTGFAEAFEAITVVF
jgi:LmbE family N-acetylglucosaminyl deacetylase